MSDTETLIKAFLQDGRDNLVNFQRSPFHEQLRSANRDNYTRLFEKYPEQALAECEYYLRKAKKLSANPRSMSNSQSFTGCWELGTQKSPQRVECFGVEDYLYRFVALTLTATLPYGGEVVRHRCHNRKCFRPDHLQIGSFAENKGDDIERIYAGRYARGE